MAYIFVLIFVLIMLMVMRSIATTPTMWICPRCQSEVTEKDECRMCGERWER